MSPYDAAGRIHKDVFVISNLVLFAACMTSVCARYFIRIYVQKQFSSDDGVLLFGVACLIVAMGLMLKVKDQMYVVGANETGDLANVPLPEDFLEQSYYFQKIVTVALLLTWFSIVSVKFSYILLFKRLIDRMPNMNTYWWVVAVYNGVISIYGAIVYGVACPYYYSLQGLQCIYGSGLRKAIAFSQSQMVLDIVGDALIIFIPCRLIWSVKIRWTQKVALASTLCLTILTIVCTIIRIAGINTGRTVKSIDSVWETYWQFVGANIAVTMTAVTAFRTVFVSRAREERQRRQEGGDPASMDTLYGKGRRILGFIFPIHLWSSWRSRNYPRASRGRNNSRDNARLKLRHQIPRATLTGMRTFIGGQGSSQWDESNQMMRSGGYEETGDDWPLNTTKVKSSHGV